jgi:hypothetical protein
MGLLSGIAGAAAGAAGLPDISSLTDAITAKLTDPSTKIGATLGKVTQVAQQIKNAPSTITDAVVKGVQQQQAGVPAAATSSDAAGASGDPPTSTNEGVEEDEQQSGGSRQYEIVHLTRRVKHPLYVTRLYGAPIYYTQDSKNNVKILPIFGGLPRTRAARHKSTKKAKKAKSSRKRKSPSKKSKRKA